MTELSGRADRVKDICRKLAPFLGEKANELYLGYLAEDKNGKEQIENYLEVVLAQHLDNNLESQTASLVPPGSAEASGEYALGNVIYAGKEFHPFGLRESEWIQHIAIFGRTGAGKTNLGYMVLQQLQKHGKPFLVFDWKRNYRDLTNLPEFKDVQVFTPGRDIAPLSFNPLIPPAGTRPKTWLKKIIEVIAHAYLLGDGVLYLLQESVDAVYEKFGLYSGQITRYPTIRDVLEEAKNRNAKGREAAWLSSTLRALASLCFGDMDTVINQGENQGVAQLLNKPVILELDALTQSDKTFFVQAMLLWVHHFRMAEGQREFFKHAILIEEAHHVLSGERRSLVGGQSVMDITFREIREYGESLIILDQHPSQVSMPALGNTYATICMNLKHSRDVSAMSQCMLMNSTEKEILGSLEVGLAVVKLQGRIAKPFVVRIPQFDIKKGLVTDEMVRQRMEPILRRIFPVRPQPLLHPSQPTVAPGQKPPQDDERQKLVLQFLRDVRDFPDSGIAARYKRVNISVRQGQKLKAKLVTEEIIAEQEELTRTGRLRKICFTEKGKSFLDHGET